MKSKKYTVIKSIFLSLLFLISSMQVLFAQGAKKPVAAGKGTTKGNILADLDCTVKINNSAKLLSVKAFTSTLVPLNIGVNSIEATSIDKKSTFKTTIKGEVGITAIVEVSFFEDNKFLDYIKQGNIAMVEAAIKKNPALITNSSELLTSSPVEIAIQNSQPEIVKLLIGSGASCTSPDNIFPLQKAALYASSTKVKDKPAPDRELVEYFLSKGCKLTDKDDGGNTPLHSAVRAGKLDLVMFMVDKGADVNAKNDFEDMPLKIAMDKGYISIINYLKSKGAQEK